MKRFIASVVTAWVYSSAVVAQTPPTDKPADAQAPAMHIATGNEQKHAREADARHCLDLKDDRAIIRCAERYRNRGVR